MNYRYSIRKRFLILLTLLGPLFGIVPQAFAQSVQNWSEPVNLSNSGAASNPSMVVDSNGKISVVWVDQFDGYKYTESADSGTTWTAPKTVKFAFSIKASPPVFLAGKEGTIHVFWLTEKYGLMYAQTTSDNLGTPSSWRSTTQLDTYVYDFNARLDDQGRLHIGYIKNPPPAPVPGVAGAFYKRSQDGGFSWSDSTLLYESSYFRALVPTDAHIRIAANGENVGVVWDDRAQKRIFMSLSTNGGLQWDAATEIVTPQSSLGFRTPYQANLDFLKDQLLLTWQVGEAGVRCTPYSSVSADQGKTWTEPARILAESTECPEKGEFIRIEPAYSTYLLTIQGNLALSAWDGSIWSNPEIQTGPSSITNPVTFDTVVLGNEQAIPYGNKLFVVGCDQGKVSDIWFVQRQLDPLAGLFPIPSAWSGDTNLTTVSQSISSLTSISDKANKVHAVWVQSPSSPTDTSDPKIQYSRWDGKEWSKPVTIIKNLAGLPLRLSLYVDNNERLLLSWTNQETGELMFTWANSERANIPPEWIPPIALPSVSRLTDSPDMLVDAANRLVIAYAVTWNEARGIYLIQSTDVGETWSAPTRVFDAVAADWDMVDQPKLSVTEDGRLHILFTRYTMLGGQQADGLYYSQSSDGGVTWSAPEAVSEQTVEWSEILAYTGSLHRIWQEKSKSLISTYDQVSIDNGTTWSSPAKIFADANVISEPSVSLDATGKLHLLELTQDLDQNLLEWQWGDGAWTLVENRTYRIQKQNYPIPLESDITSQGEILALFQFQTQALNSKLENNLESSSRSLETKENGQPFSASISTPSVAAVASTEVPEIQPLASPTSSLEGLTDPTPLVSKKLIGMVLIGSVLFLILLSAIPRRNNAKGKTGSPK